MDLNDLPAALTVEEAASVCQIGRSSAYEGVRTGEIPSIRIGRSIRVPTALLMKMLGVETIAESADRSPPDQKAGAADATTPTAPQETEVSLSPHMVDRPYPEPGQSGTAADG